MALCPKAPEFPTPLRFPRRSGVQSVFHISNNQRVVPGPTPRPWGHTGVTFEQKREYMLCDPKR